MNPPKKKKYFYFREHDATDQALWRLLTRHPKLFRDFVLRGYRQYVRSQRSRKGRDGSQIQKHKPVPATVVRQPLPDDQPWN